MSEELERYKLKPLPKTVVLKAGTSIPIFNDGTEWLTIVDSETGEEFARHRYLVPDLKHPEASDYLAIQYERAMQLVRIINLGLKAVHGTI